ncbi:MAG: FAD-dependent oxidoreductase [Firmicutes bacterium]|nr:FAD-dependent oxidoreductase [Bacillota bacterium]
MESIWKSTCDLPRFPRLTENIRTDVLVIGGGMAGLLCTRFLKDAGVSVVLAEADTLCSGTTGNTTAKLTLQHGLIYRKLLSRFGQERAKQYLQANADALSRYESMCRDIDCDYRELSSFVYAKNDPKKLDAELEALQILGYPAVWVSDLPLPLTTVGGIRMDHQAQFHPLKFAAAIAKGLPIYEHTAVRDLVGTTAVTDGGRIFAQKIIVCTHFPFLNKHGSYFLKLYQHRSYVLALKGAGDVGGMYIDADGDGLSFRNYGEYLLLGGGSHRTGQKGGGWQELRDFARSAYPASSEVYHWAAQDCMTLDGIPYIGPYSAGTENLYVATGFQKWGMTSSMAAASLLCDLVLERGNPYAEVFSPSRSMLRPQLAVNAFHAAAGYLTPTTKRCPHLGCALKWNPQEHSWDCSCHGSRFSSEGELLDGPATGDL